MLHYKKKDCAEKSKVFLLGCLFPDALFGNTIMQEISSIPI